MQSLQEKRRTIYALGKDLASISNEEVVATVEKAMKESPSAFNSQIQPLGSCFLGAESEAFGMKLLIANWKKVTPAEAFEATKGRLGPAIGFSVLALVPSFLFEDQDVVKGLQESFPLYAENFLIWSEQAHGINLYAVWLAFAEKKNIGLNVQTTTHW